MIRLAIFVSGSGTNCENLLRHFSTFDQVQPTLVLSNRADAYALQRAARFDVPTEVVDRKTFYDERALTELLQRYGVDFIVLAGFLWMAPDFLVDQYEGRMINLHPALLPKYGGRGMYGHHVHEAVKAAGERETGMTVHYVSRVCDGGEIIAQFSTPLAPDDTADDIAAKEHELEQEHFPQVVEDVLRKTFPSEF